MKEFIVIDGEQWCVIGKGTAKELRGLADGE